MRRQSTETRNHRPITLLGVLLLLFLPAALVAQGVVVSTSLSGTPAPKRVVLAKVDIDIQDGSTVRSVSWQQIFGAKARITQRADNSARVKLAPDKTYRKFLIEVLREPPVTQAQLPENVPLPPEGSVGGLQDRFQLAGLNPFSLEEGGRVTLRVTVVTTSGTYTDDLDIEVHLPFARTTGLRDVPVGVPVLLYGKEQASYNWTLAGRPPGSTAALSASSSQSPFFTPDVIGDYEVRVTDLSTGMPVSLMIYAGTFRGVITGIAANGRPIPDNDCTVCHGPSNIAPDKFTPWVQTGHAEIFTNNLNTSSHYSSACFSCHLVGWDLDADNLGADDVADYQDFLASGLLGHPSNDNWTTVVDEFPQFARRANIQCENCHGPQEYGDDVNGEGHGNLMPPGEPRVSLSADVCAVCHGEPLRHARFQQWQVSPHANYELAIDEGQSGNCSRCHSANGFLEWLPILLDDDPATDPLENVTVDWSEDETHPQTCATCHDPHAIGTTTGVETNATVRISGDTPPLIAGFQAIAVGKGAICMTCHNSRRGLHNEDVYDPMNVSEKSRATHPGPQSDLFMGENAYLVNTGVRGRHSLIEDTCVTCHMELTKPPSSLSYQQSGTNHTFRARPEICNDCHTGLQVNNLQHAFEVQIEALEGRVKGAIYDVIAEQTGMGKRIEIGGKTITNIAQVDEILLGESRGRQAINIKLTNGSETGLVSLDSVMVGTGATLVKFYALADTDGLAKAYWNLLLIENDGSKGVHNPTFVLTVLDASFDALGGRLDGTPRMTLADLQVD